MYGYIYKNTYLVTGSSYIGQHKYDKPELDRKYHGGGPVWKKIYKKHKNECTEELIEIVYSKQEADKREKYWIKYYNTVHPNGYNFTEGGDGGVVCDETLKKRSKSLKETNKNPEVKKRRSEANKKRYKDPNERKKSSEANKKRYKDPNERKKSSEANKKRYKDPNERKKTGESIKAALSTEESKIKQSVAQKKRWSKEEEREKFSKEQKERFKSIEIREKISKNTKTALNCNEIKQKQSIASTNMWKNSLIEI